MPVATYNAIYLGKVSQIMDPTEGNSVVEGRNLFNGQSYGSQADPLFTKIISMTANDLGGGLGLDTNNSVSNDTLTFDLGDGNGVRTTTYDAVQAYTNSTITYLDGSTVTVQAIIFQDTRGICFWRPRSGRPMTRIRNICQHRCVRSSLALRRATDRTWGSAMWRITLSPASRPAR